MPERFAIYYAPAISSALWPRAAQWLGRDPMAGPVSTQVPGLMRNRLDGLSVSARRYGFHATLKAPMALAQGVSGEELETALADFAATQRAVQSGPLAVRLIDGFLALVPAQQSQDLTRFAGRVVEAFEPFRSALSAVDQARRLQARLSERQAQLLEMYGYPYVFEQFQFHMTLTDRLPAEARDEVIAAAATWFAADIGAELVVDRLVLFHEAEAGAPFMRRRDFVFPERKR